MCDWPVLLMWNNVDGTCVFIPRWKAAWFHWLHQHIPATASLSAVGTAVHCVSGSTEHHRTQPVTSTHKHPHTPMLAWKCCYYVFQENKAKLWNTTPFFATFCQEAIRLIFRGWLRNTQQFFWFSIGGNVMGRRSGDGWFTRGIEVFAIRFWKEFSKIWNVWREASVFNKIIPKLPIQEEGQLRGAERTKREPFSTRKTDRFHALRLLSWLVLMIQFFTTLICSLSLFMTIMFGNSIREGWDFTINDEVHRTILWKVCTNWDYVSLINQKPYWNCTTRKFIRRHRCPIIRLKTMVKRSIDLPVILKMSGFTPCWILAFFGPPPWSHWP